MPPIPLSEITAARRRIAGTVVRTPLVRLFVDTAERAELWLKLECLQPIGSFKLRGALSAMRALDPAALAEGVYTASAGNMAQGVAWAARELGVPCTVLVPDHAPATKLAAIDRLGARVVKLPFDEWWNALVEHGRPGMRGAFIHPVSDPAVMAGNGTIGLEIAEDLPDADTVLVPYGGGGLSCGIASALRAVAPAARVFACEVETAAPLAASLHRQRPMAVEYTPTFVDGIGGRTVLDEMWPLARELLAGSLVVSVAEVAAAVRLLVERARRGRRGRRRAGRGGALRPVDVAPPRARHAAPHRLRRLRREHRRRQALHDPERRSSVTNRALPPPSPSAYSRAMPLRPPGARTWRGMVARALLAPSLAAVLSLCVATLARAQVLDKRAVLERQTWWDNRDWGWYEARIPFFESPDTAIDATYYYRWQLVTKHLTYGAPETGYTFSEFIDRPFWSGAYGAISCPLGHQMDEVRWLKDARIVTDFARYWFEAPGAQPRSYSNWYASAVWGTYLVNGDSAWLRPLVPYMKRQYDGWLAEHWDAGHRMFRWDGLHDGMEVNINSRQTDDEGEGAEGYRPTLNSYMYGDAVAIARASRLFGDTASAHSFEARAADLRARVEQELWDERRGFFLHQFAHDEKDGVRALSRTYETGKYAGDPHGREEIGFVPWQFELPERGKGYERAWKLLMDTSYFLAPFGPTTTERGDPQFQVSPRCCVWSGNSWPYATTQTLVAMANVIDDYPQDVVGAHDWMRLFEIYTRTQREDGHPYVAEGANPFTGSWAGFDTPWHSEHYFHSAYVDLVVTGVAGLRPRADDSVEVRPLAPADWAYFALDDVAYHGHRLSIVWDRDGTRYRLGRGLTILADGRAIARSARLGPVVAYLGPPRREPPARTLRNVAVNNGRGAFPYVSASWSAPENPPFYLVDGSFWYAPAPADRWTTRGSPHARDTVTVDFAVARSLEQVKLYLLDDGAGGAVRAPVAYTVQLWDGHRWISPPNARREPQRPEAHRPNVVAFAPMRASRVRVVLTPQRGAAVGMTELEAWSADSLPLAPVPAGVPVVDLAWAGSGARISASFTGARDRVDEANDLRFAFTHYSRNRWTAYGTPNARDWLAVDFGSPRTVSAVDLYLWSDGTGVKPPKRFTIEYWDGSTWRNAAERSRTPAVPTGSAVNSVRLVPVRTSRLRLVFEHDKPAASGVTEVVVR